MNLFSNSTFTWWQIGLFKLSTVTFGVAVGAYWPDLFAEYITTLLVVAVVSGVYVAYVYFKQH